MRFLCSAELVGSQLAYAVIGVLSCLQSTEVSKYVELSQLSSLASAAQVGEMGVDALLRSFLQICRGQDDSSTAQREAMLAAVRAQGAQLMSLQKALFKDEHHHEVLQTQGACALEAFRAACAGALYATSLAGGEHRAIWQDLYESSERLLKGPTATETHEELFSIARPKETDSASEEEEEVEEEDEETGKVKVEPSHAHVAACIDALMRHAVSLGATSSQQKESQQLRTFSLAEKELQTLSDAWDENKALPPTDAGGTAAFPWEKLRQKVRSDLEVAEQAAQPAFEQVTKGLEKVDLSMSRAQERLAKAKDEMHEVEKNFGQARIKAERLQLLLSSVEQRRKQARKGSDACQALEKDVKHQAEQCEEMNSNYQDLSQHCEELRHRLVELERRITRRYKNDVQPEEVLALRRTVARQLQEIGQMQQRQAEKGRKRAATAKATSDSEFRARAESDNSDGFQRETSSMDELWKELQSVREDLRMVMMTPPVIRLEEPEPEPVVQKQRLRSVAQRVQALRRKVTTFAKEVPSLCDPLNTESGSKLDQFDSIALTRFLKATNDTVKCMGPMGKITMPMDPKVLKIPGKNVTLPLQMDENDLRSLHQALVPGL